MPKQWPPLDASDIRSCVKALGFVHDHTTGTHEVWVDPVNHQMVEFDSKWNPVSSPMLQHFVTQQLRRTREEFYGATKATARKIGLRRS